jgi:glycosyltransferase involved in cell wall biosynthesis
MKQQDSPILVTVRCLAYNHAPYIRQCLEGFVMQKTSFRFQVIIHDDASTDGTDDIIREYAEKYPDIIVPIFETENQYSKRNGAISRQMNRLMKGTYAAYCEGDDYWTDPLKLQKQVSFLEQHPDYIMACNRTQLFSQKKGRFVGETLCYSSDRDISAEDTILHGGLYIPSCSSVYRWDIRDSFTDYCKNSPVGDYPLQIMCAMKGKIRYFSDCMSVYRIDIHTSWMGKRKTINSEEQLRKRVDELSREMDMLKGFADDYPAYRKYCNSRINYAYYTNYPGDSRFIPIYRELLLPKIPCHTLGWKVLVAIKKNKIPFTRKPIFDALQKRFGAVNHFYKSKEQ